MNTPPSPPFQMIYLTPSSKDRDSLRKIVDPKYSDSWGGFHVTICGRMQMDRQKISLLIDRIADISQGCTIITEKSIGKPVKWGPYIVAPIDSIFLDEIIHPIFIKEGWSDDKINKGNWHLTLCRSKDIKPSFDEYKIREIICNTVWHWVGVEFDSMEFPPNKVIWHYQKII